jgi:cyclohexanone monooxygenase
VTEEYRKHVNGHYDEIFDQVRNSITAFGFKESAIPAMSVSPEERERIFQENWDKWNRFRLMFGTFCDITCDKEANEAACDPIRRKIAQIVKEFPPHPPSISLFRHRLNACEVHFSEV